MVPPKINTRNRTKLKINKSGTTGVVRRISRNTYRWVAYIGIDQTFKSKSFSEAKYGKTQAQQMAIKWREEALKQAVENSGFTEHHGKE